MADAGFWIFIVLILVVLGAAAVASFVSLANFFYHGVRHLGSTVRHGDRDGRGK